MNELQDFVFDRYSGHGGPPPLPPSGLGLKGADRRETRHAPQKLRKEKDPQCYFPPKLCIFISYDNLF